MAASGNRAEKILAGAHTALLDERFKSEQAFRPKLVLNNSQLGDKVLADIDSELRHCSSFAFSVAFITQGGVEPLLQTLKLCEKRGIPGRILATDYSLFTQPAALRKLASLKNIQLRMYLCEGTNRESFHTKGYLFTYPDGLRKVIIGSSNMTGAALTRNHEWNIEFTATEQGELTAHAFEAFENLWQQASDLADVLEAYETIWREKQQVLRSLPVIDITRARLEPNAMQARFVGNLDALVSQGEKRALLISATGTGKTYAAAFALRHLNPERVLFLAHREQILTQAKQSFERVLDPSCTCGILSGNQHDTDARYLFATMQTMARDSTLGQFARDEFSIIVIDEVHRAGAQSYQKILDYFQADFYLGMTASPDRPDGFDIYRLFDNNIANEIRLKQALQENLLCPFHYFGITDLSVDGKPLGEEADDLALFRELTSDERVSRIIEQANYYGYSGPRVKGLIFCSTKAEAQELSNKFNERIYHEDLAAGSAYSRPRPYRTVMLSGEDSQQARESAIARLQANPGDPLYEDRLDYIFSVDIFNEGIDVPEVNQVIFLRPTESPIIFVQQLGRGLRKSPEKEFTVVLDFIGSYRNNFLIPIALSGDRSYNKDTIRKYVMEGSRIIPGASTVHFDEVAQELIFKAIDESTVTLRFLRDKYQLLKHKMGRIPRLTDFAEHGEIDPLLIMEKLGSYQAFLNKYEPEWGIEFTPDELTVFEYVSRFMANGKRPYELIAIAQLMEQHEATRESIQESARRYLNVEFDEETFRSTERMLTGEFMHSPADAKRYGSLDFAEVDEEAGDLVFASDKLVKMLENNAFVRELEDIVAYGLSRFETRYADAQDGFALYEKYSRKDVCRLLNWPYDVSSTMYGYLVTEDSCPIFVTLNKSEGISESTNYADQFLNEETFSWMSRSRRTLQSREIVDIANAAQDGRRLLLFIKKSDDEGSEFYYMGDVQVESYEQTTQPDDHGNQLDIVNFIFRMASPVRSDLYDYFTHEETLQAASA